MSRTRWKLESKHAADEPYCWNKAVRVWVEPCCAVMLQEFLRGQDRVLQKLPRDGACLFHDGVWQIVGKDGETVRRDVVAVMARNPGQYYIEAELESAADMGLYLLLMAC